MHLTRNRVGSHAVVAALARAWRGRFRQSFKIAGNVTATPRSRERGYEHVGRGFTLIELLVVMGIISILSSILLPSLAKAKRKARTIEEMSSAKQLMLGAQICSDENEDDVFPGYITDPNAKDDLGQPFGNPVNARYPWRISPYLAQSFEAIYCADNRRKLDELRGLDRAGYVYAVSLYHRWASIPTSLAATNRNFLRTGPWGQTRCLAAAPWARK